MGTLAQNLRYAVRTLGNNPGFALVVVLTLALGIGANTAIFSVVYSALLRPLPYREPDKLFHLGESRIQDDNSANGAQASYPDYLDWKRTAKGVQSFAAYSGDAFTLSANGEPKNTFAAQVTPNFFSTLGVRPALGRDFLENEMLAEDDPHVTILTDALWRTEFGGDPNIIGRVIHLNGKPVTIVGVLPRDFEFAPANSAPLWVPIHQTGDPITRRSLRWLSVFGRLAPGVSPDQVRAEMVSINAQLAREYPKENGSTFFVMESLTERIVGKIRPVLLILLGAVGFVLLITCGNVANLLMTRSIGRRKEFAVRSALGASRASMLSQLLTESLLLSFIGAGVGLLLAQWGVNLLVAAIPETQLQAMPYLRNAGLNLPVLVFLCGVTVLTGILFGLAPGLEASRSSLNDVLKDESRGGTSMGHARLRNALVIAEISISLVLLVGAGLLLKSLHALLGQDPGFNLHNVLTFSVNLPDSTYPSDKTSPYYSAAAVHFDHEFTQRLRGLPGVVDVSQTSAIPVSGGSGTIRFVIEGRTTALGQEDECQIMTVSTSYFSSLKIPLVDGRFFTANDSKGAPGTVVVSRAFVKAYMAGENPIGKRIRFTYSAKNPFLEIVGVAADTASVDLAAPLPPIIYTSNDQGPNTFLSYMVRTAGEPVAFVGAARAALQQMDPELPMIQPQSLEEVANQSPSVFLRRYPSYLIGSFAALALILAIVGLYGLIAHLVLQRTREIGIRVALGAQRRDIMRIVLRQGIRATLAGVAIGVVAGLLLTRLLSSLLYGVNPGDWLTFLSVAVLLLAVSLVACLIPALRAMRVDPIVALRYE
ncbi:MAG TPA: ABC transporter permease [Candidatus Acidoferrum sp.]|nr:ABC transporter permease [Candidatus Acidoferrum sp.]